MKVVFRFYGNLLCIAVIIAGLFCVFPAYSIAEKNHFGSTVAVVGLGEKRQSFSTFGSGFVFQWKRRVITTASVVEQIPARYLIPSNRLGILVSSDSGSYPQSIKSTSGKEQKFYPVKVTAVNKQLNIALLEAEADIDVTPLTKVSTELQSPGTGLEVKGFTARGLAISSYRGTAAFSVLSKNERQVLWSLAFPVGCGCTGGPVFIQKTGALAGMVQIRSRFVARDVFSECEALGESVGTAFVIPVSSIVSLLESTHGK